MANEETYHRLTVTGQISQRANTRAAVSKEGNPYTRTTFRVTEAPQTRIKRNGEEYNVSEEWDLNIIGGEDTNDQATKLLTTLTDLQIGDNVEVEVAVTPRRYSQANIKVLGLRNNAS